MANAGYSVLSVLFVLSDEYPFARVSVIFSGCFASFCIGQICYQQHNFRVKVTFLEIRVFSVNSINLFNSIANEKAEETSDQVNTIAGT